MTGTQIGDRPSLASWLYTASAREPPSAGFVVMIRSGDGAVAEPGWSSGFLPGAIRDRRRCRRGIPNLAMPAGTTESQRRAQLDLISDLNRRHFEPSRRANELEARIRSYEMAFSDADRSADSLRPVWRDRGGRKELSRIGTTETDEFGTFCCCARRLSSAAALLQLRSGGWTPTAT